MDHLVGDRQQRFRDGEAEGDGISPTLCRNAVLRATDRPCLRSRSAKAWAASSWGVLYRIDRRSGDAGRILWRMDPGQDSAGPQPLGAAGTRRQAAGPGSPRGYSAAHTCYMSDLGGEPQPPHVAEPQPVVERNICRPAPGCALTSPQKEAPLKRGSRWVYGKAHQLRAASTKASKQIDFFPRCPHSHQRY